MDVYTITVDSTQSPSNTSFTTKFTSPIKDVVKVEVLRASVSTTIEVPAIYVHIQELVSTFNDRVLGENTIKSVKQSNGTTLSYATSERNHLLSEAIVSWNPESIPRTTFASKTHWDSVTVFKEPIKKVGTLTISIVDNNGNIIDNNSSDITFLTLKFFCKINEPTPTKAASPKEEPKKSKYVAEPVVEPYTVPKRNHTMYIIIAILIALGAKFFIMG
jgi:hypothetical protein